MVRFIVIFGFISMPFIAWIFTRVWIFAGHQWCLEVYPAWLDRFIYSQMQPFLSKDMLEAAVQMEFIEVWIVTTIIIEILFFVLMVFLFKDDHIESH